MGIGRSRKVTPEYPTRLMANSVVTDRSGFATVPTPRAPDIAGQLSSSNYNTYGNNFRSNTTGTPWPPVSSTTFETNQKNNRCMQPAFPKAKITRLQLNKFKFRTPCRLLRKTTVRVQPKNNPGNDDSEVINISNETLSDGDMLVETDLERFHISKVRRWQIFPGHSKFWWDGRFMHGPDRYTFYGSFAVIQIIYGGYSAFVLPFLMEVTPMLLLPLITAFSYICVVSSMLYSAYTDPGIIPRSTESEIKEMEEKDLLKPNGHASCLKDHVNGMPILRRWCTTCLFYKPPRSTHCRTCDNCVERFDHHCPFIGNCVGQRNYPTFIMFLISVILSCLYVIGGCIAVLALEYAEDVTKIYQPDRPIVASWLVGIASAAVLIAVGFLYLLHLGFISQDLTTNEDFKFSNKRENPFNQGTIWRNWRQVVFTPRLPSLIQRRAFVTREFMDSLYYQKDIKTALSRQYGAEKNSTSQKPAVTKTANIPQKPIKGNTGLVDYPKKNYHIELPKSNTNKDANTTQNNLNNNNNVLDSTMSRGHEVSHVVQGINPIPEENSRTDEIQLLKGSSTTQPDLHNANYLMNNFQFKAAKSSETIKECLSDITISVNGISYPLEISTLDEPDEPMAIMQSSHPSLPFKINKESVLVDRILKKQLIPPSKCNLERFKNMEVTYLPLTHHHRHLSSQRICRSFTCSQPTVASFAGDFYKNSGTSTFIAPKTEDIAAGVQKMQIRESI